MIKRVVMFIKKYVNAQPLYQNPLSSSNNINLIIKRSRHICYLYAYRILRSVYMIKFKLQISRLSQKILKYNIKSNYLKIKHQNFNLLMRIKI